MPFRYPCYKRLTSNLGRIDAICGYATLAVDLLSENLVEKIDSRDWLSGTAQAHGLILHDVDKGLLPHRLAQMFIVTVHAQFEEFIYDFLREHQPAEFWTKRSSGQPLSHYVLANLKMQFSKDCENVREIVEYYRLIRNRFSHTEANDKRLLNKLRDIRELLNVTQDSLPPKRYTKLDYGDFDLFTRSVKTLASKICQAARPTDEQLALMAQSGSFSALKKLRSNEARYRNALQQKLFMDYFLEEAESAPIIGLVIEG